jgi:hypothetical protein
VIVDSIERGKWENKTMAGQICDEGMRINGYLFKPVIPTTHFVHGEP